MARRKERSDWVDELDLSPEVELLVRMGEAVGDCVVARLLADVPRWRRWAVDTDPYHRAASVAAITVVGILKDAGEIVTHDTIRFIADAVAIQMEGGK